MSTRLNCVPLVVSLLLCPAMAPAFEVFHSPDDDGINPTPGVAADLPVGAPHKDFFLYATNGPGVPSGDPCAGLVPGAEVCMWDLHIVCDPGITVLSLTPDAGADAVVNQQASFARLNGGDPIVGDIGAARIGVLRLTAASPGGCQIAGAKWVDNELNANDAPQPVFISTCDNDDTDQICTAVDPCAFFTNDDLTDTNGDGIPNECQCGDTETGTPGSNNGLLQAGDAFAVAGCVTNPGGCVTPIALSDTNNNGLFQAGDAFAIAGEVTTGSATAYGLTCARRPEGMPAP